MSKNKWKKEIPKQDGWYWITYHSTNGQITVPCKVIHICKTCIIRTFKNDTFTTETREPFGFDDARFGVQITPP